MFNLITIAYGFIVVAQFALGFALMVGSILLTAYVGTKLFKEQLEKAEYFGIALFGTITLICSNIVSFLIVSRIVNNLDIHGTMVAFENGSSLLQQFIIVIVFTGVFVFLVFWKIYSNYFLFNNIRIKFALLTAFVTAPWFLFFISFY